MRRRFAVLTVLPLRPLRQLHRFALLAGLLLAAVTALYGWQTWRDMRTDKMGVLQSVLALTQQSVDRYLVQMQLAMGELADNTLSDAGLRDLARAQRLLARFTLVHPELRAVHLVDMQGQVLASSTTTSLTGLPSTSTQRDYAAIRASLKVGEPFVLTHPFLGPLVHQWILPMRYTLRDAAGVPIGFLVAVAPADMLQGFWRDAPIVANAHIAAIADDGYLLTRYPLPAGADPAVVYGQPRTGALRQHLLAQHFPQSGYVEGRDVIAQQDSASVFRRLDHFPITLVVATPLSALSTSWWQGMQFALLLAGLLALTGTLVYRRDQASLGRSLRERVGHEQAMEVALDSLAASEQALQQELDSQADAICRVDAKGRVQFVNQAYCDAFGVDRAAFTGGTWHSATVAEDVPVVERRLAAMSPLSPDCLVECRMQMADGQVRWYQWSNRARFDAQGLLVDLQGVGRDVTDRKTAERALAVAMAEAADLYEHSPQGLHSLGPDGTFLRINDTELAWLGRRREDVLGRLRWLDVCTPDGAAVFERAFPAFRAGLPIEALPFTLLSTDGSTRRVSISASAILDDAGHYVMSRTVVQDVEALRRSEEQADQLARSLAAMLDTELVAVVRVKNGLIEWANRGTSRIFGYPADQLLAQPMAMLLGTDEARRLADRRDAQGSPWHAERLQFQHHRHDGSQVWLDASGMALSEDGRAYMWVMADITATKQAEASRLRAVELGAETRQMQAATRLKGIFLANMSHELRTPLNAVIGFAQLLQAGHIAPDSPKYASYIQRIATSGLELLSLIDTMLDAMQLEAGRLHFHPVPVDLRRTVSEVLGTLQPKLTAGQISPTVNIAAALSTVVIDPLRLEQVLFQLVGNAIKFSAQGGEIAIRALPESATRFRIEVQDHGIGVTAEDQARLFVDFGQLHEGNTKPYPGTGMGLSLVRRLVEAQGGRAGVRSEPGQGSVFFVVFPMAALGCSATKAG